MNKHEEFLKGLADLSRRTGILIVGDDDGGMSLQEGALPDGDYLYDSRVKGSYDSIEFSRVRCEHVEGRQSPCGLCASHPGIYDVAEMRVQWARPVMKSTKDL